MCKGGVATASESELVMLKSGIECKGIDIAAGDRCKRTGVNAKA